MDEKSPISSKVLPIPILHVTSEWRRSTILLVTRGSAVTIAILDTCVLIDSVPDLDVEFAISTVSLAELHYGLRKVTHPAHLAARAESLINVKAAFRAIPVDQRVATSYGDLCALIERAGRTVRSRTMDILIAATAHAINAPLYTKNPKDFIGLEGHVEVIAL